MWFAVISDKAVVNFYFDDETEPRYSSPLKSFLKSGTGNISGKGITYEERGQWSGGDCFCGNIFIPIPFEKSLKITSSGKTIIIIFYMKSRLLQIFSRYSDIV